jgi:hypothetical protein
MKSNKFYRLLRKAGIGRRILCSVFRHYRVVIYLPDIDVDRSGCEKGLRLAKSLIRRGYRVSLENERCRIARYTLWLWEEHSRYVNEQARKVTSDQ